MELPLRRIDYRTAPPPPELATGDAAWRDHVLFVPLIRH
jgi:hypothetical protein